MGIVPGPFFDIYNKPLVQIGPEILVFIAFVANLSAIETDFQIDFHSEVLTYVSTFKVEQMSVLD